MEALGAQRPDSQFRSRRYQQNFLGAFARREYERFYQVWHRQAGKDDTDFNAITQQIVRMDAAGDIGNYVYLFPEREQARKAFWKKVCGHRIRLIEHIPEAARAGRHWINEADMMLHLRGGSTIEVGGARFPEAWRGPSYRGVVLSEYARMNPAILEVIEPQVKLVHGWIIFNTTPFGKNHAYDLWQATQGNPKWWSELLTIDQTARDAPGEDGLPVFGEADLQDARDRGATDEWLAQEYKCSWQGVMEGSIYGRLMEQARLTGRVGPVAWEPNLPVHTWWDLGTTAVIFTQQPGREILVIDFIYDHHTFQEIVPQLFHKHRASYVYGGHHFPFDMKVTDYTAEAGRSRFETAQLLLGRDICHVGGNSRIDDRINGGMVVLPRCRFDAVRCKELVRAMESYHYEYDEERERFLSKPEKDWSSHGADAFGEMGLHVQDLPPPKGPRLSTPLPQGMWT